MKKTHNMYFPTSLPTSGILAIIVAIFCGAQAANGQSSCVTTDEVKAMTARISSGPSRPFDQKLENRLLKLEEENYLLLLKAPPEQSKDEEWLTRLTKNREETSAHLCEIIKENGWPTSSIVGVEGADAAFSLLKSTAPLKLQIQLVPVIVAAVEKNELRKDAFAGFIDRLRVALGNKQLFGTQASINNGFLVLYPIEDEAHVDLRRKQYGLSPLEQGIRELQRSYRLPLVKSAGVPTSEPARILKASIPKSLLPKLLEPETVNEDDVIRIDTNLVSLDVSVYNQRLKQFVGSLGQSDFKIFEDGREESISTFAATEVPFDLVLLLDISGSTLEHRHLMLKSTQRFINAARPSDQVAVVTFADTVNVVSPLTADRQKLLKALKNIRGTGWSNIRDALKFTMDQIVGPKRPDRRRAIVMMTDGVDQGSSISFTDLVEYVRKGDTLVIPIYLDTRKDLHFSALNSIYIRSYEIARNTLRFLATESGGLFYQARTVRDLDDIYEQVLNDLGKIYTLGYKPTNNKRDGSWRAVVIEVPNRADLAARTRSGYYAK